MKMGGIHTFHDIHEINAIQDPSAGPPGAAQVARNVRQVVKNGGGVASSVSRLISIGKRNVSGALGSPRARFGLVPILARGLPKRYVSQEE